MSREFIMTDFIKENNEVFVIADVDVKETQKYLGE